MSRQAALTHPCYQFISFLFRDQIESKLKGKVDQGSVQLADLQMYPILTLGAPQGLVRYSWVLPSHARPSHGRVGNVPVAASPHVKCVRDVQIHPRVWSAIFRLTIDLNCTRLALNVTCGRILQLEKAGRTSISQASSAHHSSLGSSESSQPGKTLPPIAAQVVSPEINHFGSSSTRAFQTRVQRQDLLLPWFSP
jgi:hypothetical protein